MRSDTIAAIATAPGAGGIGIIRVSGPDAGKILRQLFVPASSTFQGFQPWRLHRGSVLDADGVRLDEVLAVFMPGPRSFTGEDVAEWHCHGGPVLLEAVLALVLDAGARLAERGEFTRRAYLNGRMDLTQAEAVAEMIAAPTREGARLAAARLDGLLGRRMDALRERLETLRAHVCLAVDFPEEEVDCLSPLDFQKALAGVDAAAAALLAGFERNRCFTEGVLVALAGPVNAGKSSLMNALLGRERAIVTEHPGTTRDFLEEPAKLAGLPVRLVDTAGLRSASATADPVERHGIRLGKDKIAEADVIFLLFDGALASCADSLPEDIRELASGLNPQRVILVWNKADVAPPPADWARTGTFLWPSLDAKGQPPRLAVSARTGQGLEELCALARSVALAGSGRVDASEEAVPNLRQALALGRVREELTALMQDVADGVPYDLCAVRLESAVAVLAEITGLDTPDDVLNRIFASFCIGK